MLNVLLGGCAPFAGGQSSSFWWLVQTAGSDPSWGASDGRNDSAACPCCRHGVTARPQGDTHSCGRKAWAMGWYWNRLQRDVRPENCASLHPYCP